MLTQKTINRAVSNLEESMAKRLGKNKKPLESQEQARDEAKQEKSPNPLQRDRTEEQPENTSGVPGDGVESEQD